MKPTVYIETSIPSFYYETRDAVESVAMRNWTREWWDFYATRYHCFTSDAVLNELESGEHPNKSEKIELLSGIEFLPISHTIHEIVDYYMANYLMPKNQLGDALHLAIASFPVSVKGVVHKKGEEVKVLFSGIFRGNEGWQG